MLAALVAQQDRLHGLVKTTPVEQPGERVGDGLGLQLLVQMAHLRHVLHSHHHGPLLRGQRRTGHRHRQLLAGRGAQDRIMQAPGFATQVAGVQLAAKPVGHMGFLQEAQKRLALQLVHRGIEQS